jgi:hypothetical protein
LFNLSLTACSFHIKKTNSKNLNHIHALNTKINLENENGDPEQFENVIELFKAFFQQYSHNISDEHKKKTFSCLFQTENQGETDDYYYMYAIINSGIYGSASEIRDTITQEIKYSKKPTEADEKPFYLFIVIPKDNNKVKVQKGMFFFQNVGPFGVKTITTDYMQEYLSKTYKITLKCSTIAPELFIKKVLTKENIKKLIMVKNHKSDDKADNITKGYGVETRVIGNFSFNVSGWNKIMTGIRHCAKGKFNLFEFESKKYDNLKVQVNIGDRERTIDLHNLENLSIIEGIPDNIKAIDGHPHKELLIEHFKLVASEYLKEMVLQIN